MPHTSLSRGVSCEELDEIDRVLTAPRCIFRDTNIPYYLICGYHRHSASRSPFPSLAAMEARLHLARCQTADRPQTAAQCYMEADDEVENSLLKDNILWSEHFIDTKNWKILFRHHNAGIKCDAFNVNIMMK